MPREHKFLPLTISLIAGLVVSLKLIIQKDFSLTGVVITLAVLLVFYIVGLIVRAVLVALADKPEPEEENEAPEEEIPDVSTTDGEVTNKQE